MPSDLKKAFPPPVLLVTLVLAVAAIGLYLTAVTRGWILIKQSAKLNQQFYTLADVKEVGPYRLLQVLPAMSAEMVEELGTHTYQQLAYQDLRRAENEPGRVVYVHVAYYTGAYDARPHVSEKSFLVGGQRPVNPTLHPVKLESSQISETEGRITARNRAGRSITLPARQLSLQVATYQSLDNDARRESVAATFIVNGVFTPHAHEVRLHVADVHVSQPYWCQIEVKPVGVESPDQVAALAAQFLSHFLPEILTCLPSINAAPSLDAP